MKTFLIHGKLIWQCKETKKTVEYLVQNTSKSGKKIWMHTNLTPILDDAGNVIKLIAIEANISKLKKAETLNTKILTEQQFLQLTIDK